MSQVVALFETRDDGLRLIGRSSSPDVVALVRATLADDARERLRELALPAPVRSIRPEPDESEPE